MWEHWSGLNWVTLVCGCIACHAFFLSLLIRRVTFKLVSTAPKNGLNDATNDVPMSCSCSLASGIDQWDWVGVHGIIGF